MSQMTKVVNLRKEKYSQYIGRQDKTFHYGNPFSIGKSNIAKMVMPNRHEALLAFHDWLEGARFQDVEPERRAWVVENIEALRGCTLGCFCKPLGCHGDIYRVLLGELKLDEVLKPESIQPESQKSPAPKSTDDTQMGLF
jgi:hypothetical protein